LFSGKTFLVFSFLFLGRKAGEYVLIRGSWPFVFSFWFSSKQAGEHVLIACCCGPRGHRQKVFLKNHVQAAFSGDNTFSFSCLHWRDTCVTRRRHEYPEKSGKSLMGQELKLLDPESWRIDFLYDLSSRMTRPLRPY